MASLVERVSWCMDVQGFDMSCSRIKVILVFLNEVLICVNVCMCACVILLGDNE